MRGRQPGRPTKWVQAQVHEKLDVGKPGATFVVWSKWKRTDRKLGTLRINVGGLRWRAANGKKTTMRSWTEIAEWFDGPSSR
jgi:hypothetical protein